MLLNLPLIILVLAIKIFRNAKTLIMLMLFLEQARGQQRSQRETFFGGQIFWLSASNSILFGTTPLKAQNDKKC